jgi:hypothetical protein
MDTKGTRDCLAAFRLAGVSAAEIKVVNPAICYHDGVTFSYQFVASADDDFA